MSALIRFHCGSFANAPRCAGSRAIAMAMLDARMLASVPVLTISTRLKGCEVEFGGDARDRLGEIHHIVGNVEDQHAVSRQFGEIDGEGLRGSADARESRLKKRRRR